MFEVVKLPGEIIVHSLELFLHILNHGSDKSEKKVSLICERAREGCVDKLDSSIHYN